MQLKALRSVSWILLVLYCSSLMLLITLPYLSFKLNVDFLLTKQSIIHIRHWRYAFYLHILTSVFVMLAGATQFWNYFLRNYRQWHRRVGKLYVFVILFISGPAALIMSIYANGTTVAKSSFVILSLLWIFFTGIAFRFALHKSFVQHRNFMIRSYALTLSAITLRLYALILPHFVHMNGKDEYSLIAWASWTLNLLAAEIIIFYTRRRTITA
jgi:hypothetical protein